MSLPQADFEFWSLRVEYLTEAALIYLRAEEPEYASIYQKSIDGAMEQREEARRLLLSGK